jgi:hypothetical protein
MVELVDSVVAATEEPKERVETYFASAALMSVTFTSKLRLLLASG